MITLHDLLDNFCCIDPYTDYAIVNIETGEVLVDRVHDEPYKDWKVHKWELKERKMQLYISP